MKLKKLLLLTHIVLNIFLLTLAKPLYDNATYIAYGYHKLLPVVLWGITTSLCLYVFSQNIWNHYHWFAYKKIHAINCMVLAISPLIPYSIQEHWTNDIHVWSITLCLILFFGIWLLFCIQMYPKVMKFTQQFFTLILINISLLLIFGHVTLISQIFFSLLFPIFLYLKKT